MATDFELERIQERDSKTAEVWFLGPVTFAAQAARDRRYLLDKVTFLEGANAELSVSINAKLKSIEDTQQRILIRLSRVRGSDDAG